MSLKFRQHICRLVIFFSAYFLSPVLSAATFPIDIIKGNGSEEVLAQATRLEAGSKTVLKLYNTGQQSVVCSASFDPKVESAKTFSREMAAGTTSSMLYSPGRKLNRLTVRIKCRPA